MIYKNTLILAILLLCSIDYGCNLNLTAVPSTPTPTPTPTINYPRRSGSVIIKAEIIRSNLPVKQVILSNVTDFCLYGDRTLLYRVTSVAKEAYSNTSEGKKEIYSLPSTKEHINFPEIHAGKLQEKSVQELLKFIIEKKHFFNIQYESKETKKDENLFSLDVKIEKNSKTIKFYNDGPEELIDIYNLLKKREINGKIKELGPYRPARVALTVYNVPDYIEHCTRKATMWLYEDTVNLETLSGEYLPKDIEGKDLENLLDFFQKYSPNEFFYFQGEKVYGIFCKPYLPSEIVK